MNIEDVRTVNELAEFMEAEAALWGRTDSESNFVNGAGIRRQWAERLKFPVAVFYMVGEAREPTDDSPAKVSFNMTAMYFDEDGNKTTKPNTNQDVLYHND